MQPMIQRWNVQPPADSVVWNHATARQSISDARCARWLTPGYHDDDNVITSRSTYPETCRPSATFHCCRSASDQCTNKTTWSESPMTSSETRGVSRDMTGSSGGGPSLHGSVTVSIIHNIDAAGLYNEAKGEIKLTFSSTLGAGGTSNGAERAVKSESPVTKNNSAVSTTSLADLGDPDDVVSEFLSQINHAANGPSSLDEHDVPAPHRQCRSLSRVHDRTAETYVDQAPQPTSLVYEPDSKMRNYGGGCVDSQLLPVRLNGACGGDTGGGPAAETLKKMAALHRRLEEKTGSGSENYILSTSDYEHRYGAGRHALYAAPYQLPVSCCTGNGRCGMMYGAGASKPLSHYPATAAPGSLDVAFPQYGHRTAEPEVGVGGTGSSFYMSQSQCVDFRQCQPGVEARVTMAQSAALRSTSPSSAGSGWTRGGYLHPQPRYPASDHRTDWISSPYSRPEARNPTQETTGNVSYNQSRVFHGFSVKQEQSFDIDSGDGRLQPPPAYSDYLRHKQQQQFDRQWRHQTAESRWRRQPCSRHHNPATPAAPTPTSGHVTSTNVQFPVADELFFDAYTGSNVALDADSSFIDDMFIAP